MVEREEAMRLAATMYYLQDEQMDAIARRLGTSRSTVSRLLKSARESGLVQIAVRPGPDVTTGLAEQLRVTYGVAPLHEALWMRVVAERLARPDPGVQAAFQELLRRHPDVDAVLLSTNDGVPLLRGTRPPVRPQCLYYLCLRCARSHPPSPIH